MCEGTNNCLPELMLLYTDEISFCPQTDTFVIESVVNTNELLSDLTPNAHIGLENPDFNEDPFEVHSVYVAIGTLTAAICIVAVVVSVSCTNKLFALFYIPYLLR